MPEKERDWDKEMAQVDRLLAKLPAADPSLGRNAPATKGGQGATQAGAGGAVLPGRQGSWIGTWVRVGLGVAIAIGITQWPYTHGCGFPLIFYMAALSTVLVAGVWSSISSWRRRLGVAHVLSQGLIIWGLILLAREVLPRIGYAKDAASWFCP